MLQRRTTQAHVPWRLGDVLRNVRVDVPVGGSEWNGLCDGRKLLDEEQDLKITAPENY